MKRKLLLSILLLGGVAIQTKAQCDCGTGTDGAFTASSNTTLAGGTYNYTSFTIDAGVTVTVTGTAPLIINSTGDINIAGTITVSGAPGSDGVTFSNAGPGGVGVAGGHDGGAGYFDPVLGPENGLPGMGPGAGGLGSQWYSGGGGGYGTTGLNGDVFGSGGGAGGITYGTAQLTTLEGGSGGGSGSGGNNCGSGAGGAGGGVIVMSTCGTLTIAASGMILSNGGNGGSDGTGNCGGGGAGAGGSIWLVAPTLVNDGSVQANGGIGGSSSFTGPGGNGGDGRIRFDYATTSGTGTVSPMTGFTSTLLSTSTIVNSNLDCFGDLNGSATTTPTGGAGGYTYLWTSTETTATATALGAGEQIVTVTDASGCSVSDTIDITSPTQLASTGSSTDETTLTASDGTATVTVTGGTAPYTYLWTPGGGTTNPLTGLDTGNYVVTITDDNGCTMMDTVHVGQGPVSVYTTVADHGVSIYPNPASDVVTIAFKDKVNGEVMIQLTDNLGRVIATEKYNNASEFTMNTSSYAAGNYLLCISAEGSISNVLLTIRK